MVHGPTPAAVTKHWAAQQGLLDSSSHNICERCYSSSHFSTLLLTTLVPLFLYLSLLTINPSLNAFFFSHCAHFAVFVPKSDYFDAITEATLDLHSCITDMLSWALLDLQDFVLQKVPSTPWYIPLIICDIGLFLT